MVFNMSSNTVAAIATALGTAGIGIIRISGESALHIANDIFDKPLTESHQMVYGKIIYNNNIIDKALACYFKAPGSYTGEDVVELHCHGGAAVCKMVLEAVLSSGAALAPPGEFTRRAFLNNRLDLAQAEAVGDLLEAKTESAVLTAANQLEGRLSGYISRVRAKLVDTAAHLTAVFDFPDEIDDIDNDLLADNLYAVKDEIEYLLSTADDGLIIRDGINAAIIGAPNVGKSSLLNIMTGEERAIVTDIEGTTRDVIETSVNIRGCRINLSDTAGIRKSTDYIEQLGVGRSIDILKKADIIFLVLDGSRQLNTDDKKIISLIKDKNVICLINKIDMPQKISPPRFENMFQISTHTGEGFDSLFSFIFEKYSKGHLTANVLITSKRHKESLVKALEHINACIRSAFCENGTPDVLLTDLELCAAALGEVDGLTISEEIIENIFSRFCIGK